MPERTTREMTTAVLAVGPGTGRLARLGTALLFVPDHDGDPAATDALVESFLTLRREIETSVSDHTIEPGSTTDFAADSAIPFTLVDWTALTSPSAGPWQPGSGIRVVVVGNLDVDVVGRDTVHGLVGQPTDRVIDLAGSSSTRVSVDMSSDAMTDGVASTDLAAGVVPAAAFALALASEAATATNGEHAWPDAHLEVAPPSIDEVDVSDATMPPAGRVSWPDDTIDATQRRSPSPSSALGIRLPDGDVVPVTTPLVLGREPNREAARAPDDAMGVRLDAPTTVSRTHVLIEHDRVGSSLIVTDCDSRGCTALIAAPGGDADVLQPWTPTKVEVDATLLLGGPTEVAVVRVDAPALQSPELEASDVTWPPRSANRLQPAPASTEEEAI